MIRKFLRALVVVITFLLIICAAILFTIVLYKHQKYTNMVLADILAYTDSVDLDTIGYYFNEAKQFFPALFLFLLLASIPAISFFRKDQVFEVALRIGKSWKQLRVSPARVVRVGRLPYAVVLMVGALGLTAHSFGMVSPPGAGAVGKDFFAANYVNPRDVQVSFPASPATKRNLVWIYIESMENTIMSSAAGGKAIPSLTPELESLTRDPRSLTFTGSTSGENSLQMRGSSFSLGGIVSQTAGTPVLARKNLIGNQFDQLKTYMPGAYSIFEFLHTQGYDQNLVMGGHSNFGGMDKYFQSHGPVKILDYNQARREGRIPHGHNVGWWGYEDRRMYQYAKEILTENHAKNQPFSLQLETTDTHPPRGWRDPQCPNPHPDTYTNTFSCASLQIGQFIQWLYAQPFGKDTTVVLVGDHLGMKTQFYDALIGDDPSYRRSFYFTILNPVLRPQPELINNRKFTAVDLYPTVLNAIGAQVPGDRLGLGVSLYSGKKTLAEQMPMWEINAYLDSDSKYYDDKIMFLKDQGIPTNLPKVANPGPQ